MTTESRPNGWYQTADWRDRIKVGDVLYEGGNRNKPRIVRDARYCKSGPKSGLLWGVTFSILRCSWTGRPYTVVTRSDLKTRGFQPAGVHITSMTEMDKRLAAAIGRGKLPGGLRTKLTCCDVRGIR